MARTNETDIMALAYAGFAVVSLLAALMAFTYSFGGSVTELSTIIVLFAAVIGITQLLCGLLLYQSNNTSLAIALITIGSGMLWSLALILVARGQPNIDPAIKTAVMLAAFAWMALLIPAISFAAKDNKVLMVVLLVFAEVSTLFTGLSIRFDPAQLMGASVMAGVFWFVSTIIAGIGCFSPDTSFALLRRKTT